MKCDRVPSVLGQLVDIVSACEKRWNFGACNEALLLGFVSIVFLTCCPCFYCIDVDFIYLWPLIHRDL